MAAVRRKRWDVFLSHAHADAAHAKEIAAYLAQRGLSCWLDQDKLRIGNLYDDRIKQAIVDSHVVLVLVSRAATASDYVKHEVSCALAQDVTVAPAFVAEVPRELLKAPLDFTEVRRHAVNLATDDRAGALRRLGDDLLELRRGEKRRWVVRTSGIAAGVAVVAGLLGWMAWQTTQQSALATMVEGEFAFPAPAEAPAETVLDFQVYGLRAGDQQWIALRQGDALASGDHYCLRAGPQSDGYLYIFQQDSAGKVEWLFPQNETSRFSHGANPVVAGQEVYLPIEADRAYALDDVVGAETFYAFLSAVPLTDLEAALRGVKKNGGTPKLPRPSSEHVEPQPVLVGAKGIASEAAVGIVRDETRTFGGRSYAMVIKPVAFRGEGHWISVQWTIRHVPRGVR